MNHSALRFGQSRNESRDCGCPKATPPTTTPSSPLDYKSCLLAGSVTLSTKQEALCSEKQPLWEQREGERREGGNRSGGGGGGGERKKKKEVWVKVCADTDR